MLAIGLALIVETVVGHGSAISPRLLLGVLFVAAGIGRLYVRDAGAGTHEHAAPLRRGRHGPAGPAAPDGAGPAEAHAAGERSRREAERAAHELAERSRVIVRRSIGSPLRS